jgi:hypothetical protein
MMEQEVSIVCPLIDIPTKTHGLLLGHDGCYDADRADKVQRLCTLDTSSRGLTLSTLRVVWHETALDTVLDPLARSVRLELSLSSATSKQLPLVRLVDGPLLLLIDMTIVHSVTIIPSKNAIRQCEI